jgi:hypothetical protein
LPSGSSGKSQMMMTSDMTASSVVKFYNTGIIKTTDGHVIDPALS